MLLCHVQRRFDALTGTETNAGKQKETGDLLRGCQSIISELRSVVKRRRKLGHWDRIRLGSSDVNDCKNRLAKHLNILTPFLFSLELDSIGKDIGSIPATLDRLPQMLSNALPAALGKMIDQRIEDSRTAKGSIMTTYGEDDDRQAYRELRRNLRFFGIKDSVVRQQRTKLVEFIRTLTHDDHDTVMADADGDHQVPEKKAVPTPSPELIPQILHAADNIEAISAKDARTASSGRYQAYVEAEDEDESMESVFRLSSSDKTATRPEKAERFVGDDELRTHTGNNGEDGARDKAEATKSANSTPRCGESTTGVVGRRKYQAYVETEDEDDPSVPSGLPQNTSKPVPPQAFSGVSEQSNVNTKADCPSRKTGRPTARRKVKPSTNFASCGDLECKKRFISPSRSNGIISGFNRVLCDCYCSSSDQQSNSEGDDSWDHLSGSDDRDWSDSEQRTAVDDHASKPAHGGDKDVEEGRSKGYDGKPSTSFPAVPEQEELRSRPYPRQQRLIEYAPLKVNKEGLLTIQLHLPAGYSIHIEGGRFAMFHDRSAPKLSRQYFRSLPRKEYHRLSNDKHGHGFPSGPIDRWCGVSCCRAFYWTPELQYWNPGFVDGLRSWAMDGGLV